MSGHQGLSHRNIKYIRQWNFFYNWFRFRRHNLAIISKPKSLDEATFYIENTLAHGWSRSVLTHQIESGLWQRKGSALTRALPEELQSRLPSLESIEAELNKGS